eukprot:TRINITY_DN5869_c0_g1_i1.p1 TRINITY_DN5869_c0_g1~~TRINITY_DN5869_c0_g1_i1.p1  ORF type:complete len:468 (-),score=79.96 TRINITY_DN5869_c0_g1_i1:167-1399(-)
MAAATPDGVVEAAPEPVIMTVAGPMNPSEITGPILCREWLVNDQSALLSTEPTDEARPASGDRVELGRLNALRRWPTSALHNLNISLEDALRELSGSFRRRHNAGLVIVTTPRQFWHQASSRQEAAASLQSIAQECKVPLVLGTAPPPTRPASADELEAEVAALLADLAMGFGGSESSEEKLEDKVKPGFIGEIELEDCSELMLKTCIEAQKQSQAPILFCGSVSRAAFTVLDDSGCIWRKCAFFDIPNDSPVSEAEISGKGAFIGFCPPQGGADIAWEDYPGRRLLRTEDEFLQRLASGPEGRTLIGSGLRFRTDLEAFGGPGLCLSLDVLRNKKEKDEVFRASALSFLQYPWRPPAPPEKIINNVQCHWCGVWKVEGEHFSKMGFDYCAPKCISQHRQREFAPDVRGY